MDGTLVYSRCDHHPAGTCIAIEDHMDRQLDFWSITTSLDRQSLNPFLVVQCDLLNEAITNLVFSVKK